METSVGIKLRISLEMQLFSLFIVKLHTGCHKFRELSWELDARQFDCKYLHCLGSVILKNNLIK